MHLNNLQDDIITFPHLKEIYISVINTIDKIIYKEIQNRGCFIVIKGGLECGKTTLLKELSKKYQYKCEYWNFNLTYNEIKKKTKKEIKGFTPFEHLRNLFKEIKNKTEIIMIDHLEELYKSISKISIIFSYCIQKSREISVNNHPLIVIITFGSTESLEKIETTFKELKRIRDSVRLFEIKV